MSDLLTAATLGAVALGASVLAPKKKKKTSSASAKSKTKSTPKRKPGRPKSSTAKKTTASKPGRPKKAAAKTKTTATRKKATAAATPKPRKTRSVKSKFAPNKIIFDTLADARAARRTRKSKASIYKLPNNDFFVGDYKGAMNHKRKGAPAKLGALSGVTKIA